MFRRTPSLIVVCLVVVTALSLGACGRYAVPARSPRPAAPPPPDMARVFFINPGTTAGDSSTFILKETELIGYLEEESVAYVDLPEGEHFFISVSTNHEGVFARLAGGKTYYLKLSFSEGPENALGGKTAVAFWEPIVPGGEGWESRHEAVDRAKLVALNPDLAEGWNVRYSERNREWFSEYETGALSF